MSKATVLFISSQERENNHNALLEKIKYCAKFGVNPDNVNVQLATDSNMLDVMGQMKSNGMFESLTSIVLDENFVPSMQEFCSDQSVQIIGDPHPGVFRHEEAIVQKHSDLCDQIDSVFPEDDIKVFAFGGDVLPNDRALERVEYLFTRYNDRDVYMAAFLLGAKGANHIQKGLVVDNNHKPARL